MKRNNMFPIPISLITPFITETGVEFSTFDIFSDEDIRQGLKKFSSAQKVVHQCLKSKNHGP